MHSVVKAATGMAVGPVRVEDEGVAKFTWNLNRFTLLLPKNSRYSGEPAGGAIVPSKSPGSTPPMDDPCWKHT